MLFIFDAGCEWTFCVNDEGLSIESEVWQWKRLWSFGIRASFSDSCSWFFWMRAGEDSMDTASAIVGEALKDGNASVVFRYASA